MSCEKSIDTTNSSRGFSCSDFSWTFIHSFVNFPMDSFHVWFLMKDSVGDPLDTRCTLAISSRAIRASSLLDLDDGVTGELGVLSLPRLLTFVWRFP